MATRKTVRPAPKTRGATRTRKNPPRPQQGQVMRQTSAIIGAVLLGIALLWFIFLLARQLNPGMAAFTFPVAGTLMNNSSSPDDPLAAAGITLSTPPQGQQPTIGHEQALLLADQAQPGVSVKAGSVSAEYVLLSYSGGNTSYQNTPVWAVHYSKVSEPPSINPNATATQHDFYVFLNANNGQELLAIWV